LLRDTIALVSVLFYGSAGTEDTEDNLVSTYILRTINYI